MLGKVICLFAPTTHYSCWKEIISTQYSMLYYYMFATNIW